MPGIASLRAVRYYAHPRNAFWDIMGTLVGAGRNLVYEQRLERLMDVGIAVWDILHSAERQGSLDSAILNPVPNDLHGLLEKCSQIGLIATNGGFASSAFKRYAWTQLCQVKPGLRWVQLPSSSPANARLSLEAKTRLWRAALESELSLHRVEQ